MPKYFSYLKVLFVYGHKRYRLSIFIFTTYFIFKENDVHLNLCTKLI